jgi:hypothetical protein
MGLAPWEQVRNRRSGGGARSDDEDGDGVAPEKRSRERDRDIRLLRLANGILFPDRFDGVLKSSGRG